MEFKAYTAWKVQRRYKLCTALVSLSKGEWALRKKHPAIPNIHLSPVAYAGVFPYVLLLTRGCIQYLHSRDK